MKENQNQNQNRDRNQNQHHDNSDSEYGMLTGMFRDRESTESAYNSLQERGYERDDINLIMSDDTRKNHFSDDVEEMKLVLKLPKEQEKVLLLAVL